MAKPKKKIKNETQSKRQNAKRPARQAVEANNAPSVLELHWAAAIERIMAGKYADIESAIDAAIEEVIAQAGSSSGSEAEMRNFLTDLFKSDPELQTELKSILDISQE